MILASDLDHTLVHPIRNLIDGLDDIRIVEWLHGRPLSYMPAGALALLTRLAIEETFIPVTSRSRHQFERLAPVRALCSEGHAICANGATVLAHGAVDNEWASHLAIMLRATASLSEAQDTLVAEFGVPDPQGWLLRAHTCDEAYWYGVCDATRIPPGVVRQANLVLDPLGWRAICHGRKLYALPRCLTKDAALRYLLAKLDLEQPVVCAGDSELDQGLLQLADVALSPAGSPAALSPECQPVRLVHGPPVQATEEILAIAMSFARSGASNERHVADDEAVA